MGTESANGPFGCAEVKAKHLAKVRAGWERGWVDADVELTAAMHEQEVSRRGDPRLGRLERDAHLKRDAVRVVRVHAAAHMPEDGCDLQVCIESRSAATGEKAQKRGRGR